MIRHAALIALLSFSGSLAAQIFPKIEKEDVKKRIATGKPDKPEVEPEPDEDEPGDAEEDIDGDEVLARYNEILDGYFEDDRDIKKQTTKHTDDLHDGIRKFFEGACLLRLGFYKDAERLFKDVRYKVEDEEHIKNEAVANVARDIKSGAGYYYRAIAAAMQHWEAFEDRTALDKAWLEAKEDALDVKDDLESLIRRGLVENGGKWVQAISVWVYDAEEHWVSLFRAEQNTRKHPDNFNTWRTLVNCTSSADYKIENEYTPAFLKQRAAIQVIKEFWPDSAYLTGGQADIALGANHVTTGQLDDWDAHYSPKPYHTPAAKKLLNATKWVTEKFVDAIEGMKQD